MTSALNNPIIVSVGGRAPPEQNTPMPFSESRWPGEALALRVQFLDPGSLSGCHAILATRVGFLLLNPTPQRVPTTDDLRCNRLERCRLALVPVITMQWLMTFAARSRPALGAWTASSARCRYSAICLSTCRSSLIIACNWRRNRNCPPSMGRSIWGEVLLLMPFCTSLRTSLSSSKAC